MRRRINYPKSRLPLEPADPILGRVLNELIAEGIDLNDLDLSREIGSVMDRLIPEFGARLADRLKEDAPAAIRARRVQRRVFSRRINTTWRDSLDALEALMLIAREIGQKYAHRRASAAHRANDLVHVALMGIYARALQTADEIIHLLHGGFPGGAHARWRTLHEMAVLSAFVAQHGSDTAKRYLLHSGVESYRSMTRYLEHHEALGFAPPPEDAVQRVRARYEALIGRFGPDYSSDYGWAGTALHLRRPKLPDLERAVGLEKWRPLYKLSSDAVHGVPRATASTSGWTADSREGYSSVRATSDSPTQGRAPRFRCSRSHPRLWDGNRTRRISFHWRRCTCCARTWSRCSQTRSSIGRLTDRRQLLGQMPL